MFENFRIEDMVRLAAADGCEELIEGTTIEASGRFYSYSGVVVSTYDTWVAFVDSPRSVGGIVNDVIEKKLFGDGTIGVGINN